MKEIRHIIDFYIKNNYSDGIKKNFVEWFTTGVDSSVKEQTLHSVWESTSASCDSTTLKAYQKLQFKICGTQNTSRRRVQLSKILKVAAIFILPLFTALLTYTITNRPIDVEFVECYVPFGETKQVLLSDSTVVNLNSGSLLVYPKTFAHTSSRNVHLNGEASFDVTKKGGQPFIVTARDLKIKVLGTEFSVHAYNNDKIQKTTLKSGRVDVFVAGYKYSPVSLEPNEQLVYDSESGVVRKILNVNTEKEYAWHDGSIVLEGASIHEIALCIERKYNTRVYVTSDKYDKARITARLSNEANIEELLSILSDLIPNLKYVIQSNNIYIN